MAKLCELVDEATNQCVTWVDYSILPELTATDRDALLLWMISIFAVVFAVKRLARLFGS